MSCCKPQKTDRPIEGVKCSVDECYYNTCDCGCTASMIEVTKNTERRPEKTDCNTFREKE